MPTNKELKDVWTASMREELLTVIWAILTVLLFTSQVKILMLFGIVTGIWTARCMIGIFSNAWPQREPAPEIVHKDVCDFLNEKFNNKKYLNTMTDSGRKLVIEETAAIIMNVFERKPHDRQK